MGLAARAPAEGARAGGGRRTVQCGDSGLLDHAERSVRLSRLSAAASTRAAVRGRP